MHRLLFAGLLTVALAPAPALARATIEVVGSSTIFPFTALVIDRFVKTTGFRVINRSSGTGGGINTFCAGLGDDHPDIVAASRPMTEAERARCYANDIKEIVEIKIGSDGIVLASQARGIRFDATRRQLFAALAKQWPQGEQLIDNPHQSWRDVDPAFPDKPIVVLGPPVTSGTRDAFIELAMTPGCEAFPAIRQLSPERKREVCGTLRNGGHYIDMGENDTEIVKRLQREPDALGIFGYSYALKSGGTIVPIPIDGVVPTEQTIASGQYPLARPLFLYVKAAHLAVAPGLKPFLVEYTSERAFGPEGYLADAGLIALPAAERAQARDAVATLGSGGGAPKR